MSARSLTHIEAGERAALITVRSYDIAIDFTALPDGPEVRCVSTVTFDCHEPGAATFVDCAAEVVAATLNGKPLAAAEDGRIALPELAAENVLRVESLQSETTEGEGVHKAVDPADGEVYVWTSFEPDEARNVWACFDQPDLKAPHTFTVTAPAHWTVTSNSGDPVVEPAGAARRWSFPATPTLAPYNTVVNGGPFHELRSSRDGYDLGVFARRSLATQLERDAEEIFTVTAQGLAFFGDVFGMPFPQVKYDQVFMPEFGGAMENYGCVTWTDNFLRRSIPTPAERESFASVLLHEMAHMWFGNIVTMRWWDDLWLNEAFAEFACFWACERATSFTDAWAGHLAIGKIEAYLTDQGPISHPIRLPVRDVAEAASIFDNITYPKGASVLQQLMIYVGEDAFTAGMKNYFAKYAWGNTSLQDLIDELAATSGRDLDTWRTGWLETAGTDRLGLDREGDALVLTGRGPAGPPRPQVLAVGAYQRQDGKLTRTAVARVDVQGPRTPVDLPPGADLYLVNDDDLTFATTRPEAAGRDTFFSDAALLPSAISRGVAVVTAWDMLCNAEATPAEVLDCITGVLATETSDSVVEPYLKLAGQVVTLWSRPGLEPALYAAAVELAAQPSRRAVALRTVARHLPDLDAVAALQAEVPDDIEVQWRILVRKAELGGDVAAEAAALVERDPDPDAAQRIFVVRAARPDAAEKAAVWQALVDRDVKLAFTGRVASAFWLPGQDELLAPYAAKYLDLLPGLHRGGMIPAMVYTDVFFPMFAIDDSYFATLEQAAEQTAPVVRKGVAERADVVRRMLRSRG
jgi:aminopeptidase N